MSAATTTIIGSYLSPYVRKVLVCLEIKGIAYEIDPIVPFYGITWFPSEGWEASAAATVSFNQTNQTTGYRSGREALVDFGADRVVAPGLRVGLSGYAYKQLSDDVLNGVTVAGGNRGQVFALGPQVRYRASKNFGITFKWHPEFKVENRSVGNRAFIQFFNAF